MIYDLLCLDVCITEMFFNTTKVSLILSSSPIYYENTPIQIYRKFHLQKLKKFR